MFPVPTSVSLLLLEPWGGERRGRKNAEFGGNRLSMRRLRAVVGGVLRRESARVAGRDTSAAKKNFGVVTTWLARLEL